MPVLLRPSIHRNLAQALTHHENFLTWPTMEVGGSMDQQLGLLATTCSYITIYNMHNIHYIQKCIIMYLYPYQDPYTGLYLAHSCTADIKHSFFGRFRTSGGFPRHLARPWRRRAVSFTLRRLRKGTGTSLTGNAHRNT